MNLYLVRHGEAKPESEDPRRPLSQGGRDEVARASRAAVEKGMKAARILHSDKLRTRESAEILAGMVHPSEGICEIKGLAPQDDPLIAKEEVEEEEEGSLILVGHLPHLERFFDLLVSGGTGSQAIRFQTGTIVCLNQSQGRWKFMWVLDPGSV